MLIYHYILTMTISNLVTKKFNFLLYNFEGFVVDFYFSNKNKRFKHLYRLQYSSILHIIQTIMNYNFQDLHVIIVN